MASKKKVAKKTPKVNRPQKKGKVHASKTGKTKPASKAIEVIPQAATPLGRKQQVTISAAKGRPMLTWVGKRPLRSVTPFPAQPIESFTVPNADKVLTRNAEIWKDWPSRYPQGGLLFHGDNKEVLAHLLANGFRNKIHLIYIDPPFDSGADYVRKVNLRGPGGTAKFEGESYSLGEQLQYTDIWANDNYLQFMFERLMLMKELLCEGGSIFLHCDESQSHRLRSLLDEVFDSKWFQNEVIWYYTNKYGAGSQAFDVFHNTVLWYSNGKLRGFNTLRVPVKEKRLQPVRKWNKELGKNEWLKGPDGEYLYQESKEKDLGDVWEIPVINPMALERTDYRTQKPETLLNYVTRCSSNVGDLVLDVFLGSGTTAAVAQKLGRRWIGCDINKGAIQTTTKRLQSVLVEQVASSKSSSQQQELLTDDKPKAAPPAQLGFTVHRVNDYDLAIQHNEAVNLACEHIGVTRTLSDSFFDGTLGQKLVKIIPFGHPLSRTDLQDVRAKIESRPNDSRDVVVVCLGKELGVDGWLAEWNRMRKQGNTPNKIEIIELRTDPKYGKFFAHKPAQARVKIRRSDGKLTIDIQDFLSPTILERLQEQAGPLLAPKVTDWRAMVDSVMIDPSYDGKVFNIALADVPEHKQDFVQGRYELPAPKAKTVVAVKVTDMLGEEVLAQQEV